MEPLVIRETPGAPIACDMTSAPDTPEERIAEYGRLFAHALVGRERTAEAVEFTFAAKPGVAEWVADLAKREAACCPFFTYNVTFTAERVVWRTSSQAGPAAQVTLDEFHTLPERFGDGLDGFLNRLRARGMAVATPGPGRFALDEKQGSSGLLGKLKGACGC
jgi:hypothetical protein